LGKRGAVGEAAVSYYEIHIAFFCAKKKRSQEHILQFA
jgi:hypothetical protein